MVIIVTLFLVSNNLVIDNILYETDEGVEDKRINRPLSIEGEKASVKLVKKIKANIVYSSSYASSIGAAKYYASYKNVDININSFLNDLRIGDLGRRNIKMLRFMQERDFDFKFNHGESLNEVNKRMNIAIDRIIKKNVNKLEHGYNLDDRLVLSFNERVIIDDNLSDVDIIKVDFEKGKVVNCEVIDYEI